MSDGQQRPRKGAKRRRLKRIGALGLLLLLIASGAYTIWHAKAKADLDAEIAGIRARGEPLAFDELGTAEQESAATSRLRDALSRLVGTEFGEVCRTLYRWTGVPQPGKLVAPGDYPVLHAALTTNREAIDELRSLARNPDVCLLSDCPAFPVDAQLPHLLRLRMLAQLLLAQVIQALGAGDHPLAVESIADMFPIADLLRDRTCLASQYSCRRAQEYALDGLEGVLQSVALDGTQRRRLDELLEQAEQNFRFRPTFVSERAALYTMVDPVHAKRIERYIADMPGMKLGGYSTLDRLLIRWDASRARWWASALYRPRLLESKTFGLRFMNRFMELVDEPGPATTQRWKDACDEWKTQGVDYPMSALLFPSVPATRELGLRHRQRLIAARLGLRVDAFYRREGRLPDGLDAVLDERMPSLPNGLMSGRPLHYEQAAAGFQIYDDQDLDPTGLQERMRSFTVEYPR